MNLTSRTWRRVGVVASAISAAVLVPAVALAAPGHAGPAARTAAPPKCTSSQLRVWLGVPGDGAAGSTQYQLELSDISSRSCTVFGFPGVSAFGPHGQLGSAAGRSGGGSRLITLHTGATVHVELSIADVGNFTRSVCRPVTADGLQVFPPNDTVSQRVPFPFAACSKRGPVYLHISTSVTGTGIPGFSS
jgi:hypothetical protein